MLCATALALTPAAGQQLRYLDAQDVAQAQRENAQVIQELGGAETGTRAAYVDSVGHRVGAFSGIANPAQALHFTTLNSAVENAFSVPGGYVYVTRQLMALMDDESELAFALGHEVGHIAANHAHQREEVEQELAREALPWVMMGQMMGGYGSEVALRNILAAKLQSLSFSREQEYEADTLGLRYMMAAGYDPSGAADLLQALSRETALEARVQGQKNRSIPEWALTH
ncbi:MAG TPA: M48 family metalloprotease, partial [Sphingomicrobium sp.]|nr:M48 family metalloprotease [Sphingomicrobium sp.]